MGECQALEHLVVLRQQQEAWPEALRPAEELLARAVEAGGDAALASVEWDNAELKSLHLALSDEMKREVRELVRLHEEPVEPARRTA